MSIAILPARLANQIAAGEVVERPASVIKELVENSLDAGATKIHIDVDKGGIKKIKITDNGHGIIKDELTLALSRHATSKIKDLNDLEAIGSLGFRGEALASISSVARLTLTSKPKDQPTAWQAVAEGRDMSVNVQPAAHPDGTSIEVLDLFFNTPARRKFLRTEKTEFNHIDEVIRRIALANFAVSFTLTHNGNNVRQYRMANTQAQFTKRVAMVCGQKFIEHAIEVDCPHDNMKLSGWLAKPSFSRNQNDLCYSYVNGRMMRDKLINHAIRQAYANLLPADTYPAFVLFLELDHKEVDVNVHPAKHEVRFHQSRYVHDFIFSACNKALLSVLDSEEMFVSDENDMAIAPEQSYSSSSANSSPVDPSSINYPRADYIKPLQQVSDSQNNHSSYGYGGSSGQRADNRFSQQASTNYQSLLSSDIANSMHKQEVVSNNTEFEGEELPQQSNLNQNDFISVQAPGYALYKAKSGLRVLSLFKLAKKVNVKLVEQSWQEAPISEVEQHQALVSQPLLLPVIISLSKEQFDITNELHYQLAEAGIVLSLKDKNKVQIRQFPALLREQDVTSAFNIILTELSQQPVEANLSLIHAIAEAMLLEHYDETQSDLLLIAAKKLFNEQLSEQLLLNSIPLDLTSHIKQLV